MLEEWIAKPLKCNYFNSPWAFISFLAATMLPPITLNTSHTFHSFVYFRIVEVVDPIG